MKENNKDSVETANKQEAAATIEIKDNDLGMGILDTLQKNMSVHVAIDLIGRFLLSYMFNKNPELIQKEKYEIWDFAEGETADKEPVDSSNYTITTVPIAGSVGGRIYPFSVLNKVGSLPFKALISDIKEAVEACLAKKPVAGTVRLIVNVSDKGTLLITLMYIHKELE